MKQSLNQRKSHMADEVTFELLEVKDFGFLSQFLSVYLGKLSLKDLKEAKKDIARLKEYIEKQGIQA